jgi:hypothetical protein
MGGWCGQQRYRLKPRQPGCRAHCQSVQAGFITVMEDHRPARMLAILLGASTFPNAPGLAESRAFHKSAADVKEYFWDESGLSLPMRNVLSLFDDSRPPSDQLVEIASFLQRRKSQLEDDRSRPEGLMLRLASLTRKRFASGRFSSCDECSKSISDKPVIDPEHVPEAIRIPPAPDASALTLAGWRSCAGCGAHFNRQVNELLHEEAYFLDHAPS